MNNKSTEILLKVKEASGLTWNELAERIGYSSGKRLNDIAKGRREMRGPAINSLDYFSQSILTEEEKKDIPEFVIGSALEDNTCFIFRSYYPRALFKLEKGSELKVVMWIDSCEAKEKKVVSDKLNETLREREK